MKITNNKTQIYKSNNYIQTKNTSNNQSLKAATVEKKAVRVPVVSFKAINGIKEKKIDTEAEKNRLLKQFNEILASDMSIEDLLHLYERQVVSQFAQRAQKADELIKQTDVIMNSHNMTDQQKAEHLISLKKEFKTLQKNMFKVKPFIPPKPPEKNMDTALINKFKTALLEDNFNLDKVNRDYYSGLNNITTIEDLTKKYPKISIPENPEYVIADKLASALTRDFYEKLDRLFHKQDKKGIYNLCEGKIRELLQQSVKNPSEIYEKVAETTVVFLLMRYDKLRKTDSFSSVPQFRKNAPVKISENDLKLLSVDFDDFVLSVLKKQYLENKKPNEIVYSNSDVTIPVSSLKENVYKFEKIPEKIKSFIQTAKTIQSAMRDYEHFDDKKLKERLHYYAGQAIGNNETVFDRIVEFDAADISGENRDLLIKFLKVFDDFKDREKTIYEVLDIIEEEDLRPKAPAGGEDIDETERQKAIEALKRQQKMAFELDSLKSEFDNAMNTLYANNLSSTAAICSKYRPSNLDYTVTENAEFIINQAKSLDKSDKNMVKSKIKNFDTYNYYKNNDYKNPVFADALKYAENDDGKTDIDKAGRYLANSEIVMNAPQSLEYLKNKDFLENVINRSPDKNAAVKYLCKYDEYNEMSTKEKSHLLSFVDKFNLKDSIDKLILKNIIENDYINTDTVSLSGTNDSDRVEATISANAKQQIIHKYMYPRCLEFFTGFEEALKQFATDRGTSGIKKTGTKNKALDYKLELKLMGHDDRLFSVENNYYFDIFSDKGLH